MRFCLLLFILKLLSHLYFRILFILPFLGGIAGAKTDSIKIEVDVPLMGLPAWFGDAPEEPTTTPTTVITTTTSIDLSSTIFSTEPQSTVTTVTSIPEWIFTSQSLLQTTTETTIEEPNPVYNGLTDQNINSDLNDTDSSELILQDFDIIDVEASNLTITDLDFPDLNETDLVWFNHTMLNETITETMNAPKVNIPWSWIYLSVIVLFATIIICGLSYLTISAIIKLIETCKTLNGYLNTMDSIAHFYFK